MDTERDRATEREREREEDGVDERRSINRRICGESRTDKGCLCLLPPLFLEMASRVCQMRLYSYMGAIVLE